ncbi:MULTISPECIES: LLM class flavin-dependent oxidoreductase [unclassified Nocardioides]|uniref:LLM class flavin-dependent oxidoreductase n=1 Tax=unclassified Nocardioides TaxID=2615069 RepID=UPI0006FCA721|nr:MULTISPECIES: LLM class flavin-dependent oxidoreductase [unclassified Nocardioides]KQY54314.1 luciferase [Nocardioides sp. Root140]KQZ74935.1 luciferase [Nocardioides sp. Root151]
MPRTALRFTFALPDPDPVQQSHVFRAALEMAQFADTKGVDLISLDEHHSSGFGWSSNPILTGGMILASTERIRVGVAAALGPLWDPIRLAEDLAVVDQVSGGRMSVTLGLGYRPVEYAAMGKDYSQRGKLMDQLLETLLKAWTGEPFDHNGTTVAITPRPLTQPHPFIMVGGSAKATARRAVRFRLPLQIPDHLPDLLAHYEELCRAEGIEPVANMVAAHRPGMVILHEDPERAWSQLGRHLMWEAVEYGAWAASDMKSVMHVRGVRSIEDVRASGRYRVLTPEELLAELAEQGPEASVTLHPLVGGMPIDEAWKSVHLLTDEVIPRLQAQHLPGTDRAERSAATS